MGTKNWETKAETFVYHLLAEISVNEKNPSVFFFWLEICWPMRYLEAPANLVSASPAVGSNSRVNHGGVQVINHRKR